MERFLEREIVFANGSIGEAIEFQSAGPANFHEIMNGADLPKIMIDGKLFVPPDHDGSPLPCVIVRGRLCSVYRRSVRGALGRCDL